MNSVEKNTLPKDWVDTTIEATCEVLDRLRKPISQKDRKSGEYPYYGATKIVDYINDFIFDERLVLVGEDGAKWERGDKTGFIAEGKYWVNNHAHVLRVDKDVLIDKWLVNFLDVTDLSDYITGTTVPKLNQAKLKSINFPLPPLEEQKRIVAKIDTLFAKIDKAISLTEESLKQAKNLLPSVLKEVFEKGEADGWEEKRLEEVVSYDKSKYKGHNRPYVGLEHIESNTSIFLGNKEPLNVKSSTFMFDKRHVLYGRLRPYLNKVLVPDFNGHCSTEIFPILTNGKLIRRYLAYWLMSPVTNAKIDATWTGARMPRANMNEVIKFKLPVPTKETQKSIVELFDNFSNQSKQTQSKLEEQLAYLKQLKSSILGKAFNGEL